LLHTKNYYRITKEKLLTKPFIKKRTMKTKKILLTAIATIVFIAGANAQNVTIPDANFKAALVNNSSINTNMDAEIQVSEASVFNGAINVSGLGISDLTGIEAFVLLDSLDCSYNQLAALNVSACSVLTTLDCSYNYPITSLDFSANSLLTYLDCSGGSVNPGKGWVLGQLTSLDLSSNPILTYLNCFGNQLTSLDLSSNLTLDYLDCGRNNFTSLNISSSTALTTLKCHSNLLSGIDVSFNTALIYLDCSDNQLTSLDVSANASLASLNCGYNQLISLDVSAITSLAGLNCSSNHPMTSLDVSANTLLTYLDCSGCVVWDSGSWSESQLAYLNVKNGNNINMSDHSFFALCNPNLTCIEVDNASWSTTNWAGFSYLVVHFFPGTDEPYFVTSFQSNIDGGAVYSENCSGAGILDNNESNAPIFYPNPTTGTIYLSELANITLSDLSGKVLLDEKNTMQLDISALPAGLYFLNVGENNQHTFRVIKE
jgi:hypothetical protein